MNWSGWGEILNQLPREHWHPLVVHFSIGMWVAASILYLLSLTPLFYWLRTSALVIGLLGTLFGWLSVESGEMAARIVAQGLCHADWLKNHEEHAETAQIFFAGIWGLATLFQLIQNRFLEGREAHFLLRLLFAIAILLACGFLVSAGHYGYKLVYWDAAAVKSASVICQ